MTSAKAAFNEHEYETRYEARVQKHYNKVEARAEWVKTLPTTLPCGAEICRSQQAFTDSCGNFLLALPKTGTPAGELNAYFVRNFSAGEEEE